MMAVTANLRRIGITIEKLSSSDCTSADAVVVTAKRKLKPLDVTTQPYPGFPTDLQAQFMAFMALTQGVSVITDKVYPDRFMHIAELNRMGANIRRDGPNAIVQGIKTVSYTHLTLPTTPYV